MPDPIFADPRLAAIYDDLDGVRDDLDFYVALAETTVGAVTMTGNVAQVFVDDDDWLSTLRSIRRRLSPGGQLIFETRDPAARAWERWNRSASFARTGISGIGTVESWVELLDVELSFVSFRWTFRFVDTGELLTSDSTLRFRDRAEIETTLGQCGFGVFEVLDAPDRPGAEFVFVASPRR